MGIHRWEDDEYDNYDDDDFDNYDDYNIDDDDNFDNQDDDSWWMIGRNLPGAWKLRGQKASLPQVIVDTKA